MYKVGIIGFGKMGMLHGALLCASGKAEIKAVCDKSLVMRLGFKRAYKRVNTYNDAKTMLEKENLDIVIVTTPTFNHEESVCMALEKGCAVFCEKPLAINSRQINSIYNIASAKKLSVKVGFCNRFAPSFIKGKELFESNAIGTIKTIKAEQFIGDVLDEHNGWRYNKELSGGGALMDFGIHMVDLLIQYFGCISEIKADSRRIYSKSVEDEVSAEIIFKSGAICEFATSWSKADCRKAYSKITAVGENGKIVVTDQTLDLYDNAGGKIEEYTYPDLYGGDYIDIGGMLYSHQMAEFISCIEGEKGNNIGCTPKQALYVQEIIEAIYSSAENKCVVEVGDSIES